MLEWRHLALQQRSGLSNFSGTGPPSAGSRRNTNGFSKNFQRVLPLPEGLEPLGKRRKECGEATGPGGPSERERASHWAGVRGKDAPLSFRATERGKRKFLIATQSFRQSHQTKTCHRCKTTHKSHYAERNKTKGTSSHIWPAACQVFMKALASLLLLSLMFATGCSRSASSRRTAGSGEFTLTNNAAAIGTVFWGNLHDATTNEIQYVLILPKTTEAVLHGQTQNDASYSCGDFKLERNGHQWRIEAFGTLSNGTKSLQISDMTAQTVTSVTLPLGRFWRVSEDGTPTRLDKIDEAITQEIATQLRQQQN